MAEKLSPKSHENESPSPEAVSAAAAEQSKKNIERIKQLAEQEKTPDESTVETLREKVESVSVASEQVPVETQEKKQPAAFNQGDLRRISFNKTMSKVQAKLPPAERVFSKVIHQKTVETVSNIGSKTVARPSGVLGGGLIAFLGSILVLYFAKHYGFEYNYTLFIILYVLGFAGGLLFEFIAHARHKTQNR